MSTDTVSYFPEVVQQMDLTSSSFEADRERTVVEEATDEALVLAVGSKSKEALSVLFQRHGRAVLHIAQRIVRDEAEAADIRQDVFLYVFEKGKLFDPGKGTAASWIMQIAYHRAIDRRRYLSNRQHYTAPVFDEQQSHMGSRSLSTDTIDGKAILSRLRETLSRDQQRTLELHLFDGYSLREIADRSGQTVGNIRNHYYRALERLRAQVFPAKRR